MLTAIQVGRGGGLNYMMCKKLILVHPRIQRIQRRMNVMQAAPRRMIALFIWRRMNLMQQVARRRTN